MKNLYVTLFSAFLLGSTICTGCAEKKTGSSGEVIEMIHKVNGYWQTNHPEHGRSFWDNAAYHTGNMEVYFLTKKPEYLVNVILLVFILLYTNKIAVIAPCKRNRIETKSVF